MPFNFNCSFKEFEKRYLNNPKYIFLVFSIIVITIQSFKSAIPFDDAFITFRYARNISQGLGFVYNPGYKVLGTTTPLFTLLLSILGSIFSPQYLPKVSQIIGILADVINAYLIYKLSNRILKDSFSALIITLAFIFQPFRISVSLGGMETSLFLTFLFLMYDRYLIGSRSVKTAIWAGLAILTRPDAIIAIIPIIVDWYFKEPLRLVKFLFYVSLIVSPWFIFSKLYFGSFLPNSILAKSIAYNNPFGHSLSYFLTFLGTGTNGPYPSLFSLIPGTFIGIPVLIFGSLRIIKDSHQGIIITAYPLIYMVVMSIVNPAMFFPWYFVPLIPGLLITIVSSIRYATFLSMTNRTYLTILLFIGLLVIPNILLSKYPSWSLTRTREKAFFELCDDLPEENVGNKSILAPDIGVIGWCYQDAIILDPIGLVSPDAIPYLYDLPQGQLVSEKLVIDKEPDYIFSFDYLIYPQLKDSNYFQTNYQKYKVYNVSLTNNHRSFLIFSLKE